MPQIDVKKKIYTVTELTRYIRVMLEDTFSQVWVEGEISNLTKHSSGHTYFSIKDEMSILNCVLFRGAGQEVKFKIENGLKVMCFGRIGVYDKRGQYQLYIEKMEPKGIGALQLAFDQLKERLRKEGLFDQDHKRPIPYLPYKIGIVTSPTGAAIKDVLRVTRERFQNVDLIITPVRVQGKGAELEIAQAIEDLNKFYDVDVIIVARGGGSLEDLWAFNEEIVARTIYNSRIPIISAVGHEVDWTIADFVADFRAPTPSAAAEQVIPRKEDLIKRIEDARYGLKNALIGIVNLREGQLKQLTGRYVFRQPLRMVQQFQQRVDDLVKGLILRIGHIIEINDSILKKARGKLESLSPSGVLERGYSITVKLPKGQVLKGVRGLKSGDRIKTKLRRGIIISRVERIEEGERPWQR